MARKGVLEIVSGASRGIRINDSALPQHSTSTYEARESAPSHWLSLPLIGRVAAGNPILAQEHVETHFRFDKHLFTQMPDYLLRVRGMSMRDAGILDGDLIAVKRTQEARNGQIVVARLGDEVTVKRFKRTPQGIELLPENPDFEPILVSPDHPDFELEGLAVGLIRNQPLM